ncbi:MAG TPA: DUF1660 family phage protein [Thermoanaerobaculia bacterium]|jgi:hypothetical protein|nr:DUF1660 family phage protein [Thermoanaerobaculia bacterium]
MGLLCALLGHKWHPHLVAGSDGEPAEDECSRCKIAIQVPGYCRCLHPCDCVPTEERGRRVHMNIPRRFVYQEEQQGEHDD